MTYIPKNIKVGMKIEKARELLQNYPKNMNILMEVSSFSNSHDVYGNGTAHYECHIILGHKDDKARLDVACVVQSGAKREQVGYSGANEAALYALNKLGYEIDTSNKSSYDYKETVYYPVTNI
ncbi:hypothetical protein KLEP7_gp79 [Pseudaeromonas phage vB_PpeM_ KLEP7]|nr:hypothetical protein KLEP7_gp79 [Pseudaeromonas phage vB_PpeM_ KLEP7]